MNTSIASDRPCGGPALPQIPNRWRTPFHLSGLRPGSKRQKLVHGVDDQGTGVSSKAANLVQVKSHCSGSDGNATRWFEEANENVPIGHDGTLQTNNDEPFFLSAQQSSYPYNLDSAYGDDLFGAENEVDGEKEELREVIDDLTIENKRLKKLLKSQRSTTRPRPEASERLFDLRVHGLSAEKKRELELMLRNFTAQANTPALRSGSAATHGARTADGSAEKNHSTSTVPPQPHCKPQLTDSGYGTNSHTTSHSGLDSAAVSSEGRSAVPTSSSCRNQNSKSYLHDIPNTFIPHQAPFMNERTKQALVVSRLEQLFTGKQVAPGEHDQPIQQQEISKSAAKADAGANHIAEIEGTREAPIQPYDTNINVDLTNRRDASLEDKFPHTNTHPTPTQPETPDQRPTRPLDLDIHRAQVASDNIEYIRHLGLSTPRIHQANDSKDQSWIYLNLLTGMAQLHTLNVTPAFIQNAIKKMSTKFELSEDGKRVRWKDGFEGTTLSAFEDRAVEASTEAVPETLEQRNGSGSQRSKTYTSSNNLISEESSFEDSGRYTSGTCRPNDWTSVISNLQSASTNVEYEPISAVKYKPLIYKDKKCSAAASYREPTSSSSLSVNSGNLVRMLTSSIPDGASASDDGMITYFSNPFFCRDASMEKSPINWKPQRLLKSGEGLGTKQEPYKESPLRVADACYFTPQFAPKPWLGELDECRLYFPVLSIDSCGEEETQPMKMEVSGIGGICPEDNFAVDVKILRQARTLQTVVQPDVVPLTGSRKRKRYSYRTTRCDILELQPSELPSPTYLFFTSSSSSADSSTEDSDSDASLSADGDVPAPALFLNRWSTGSFDGKSDTGEEESGSIDVPALARAADPERAVAQEP